MADDRTFFQKLKRGLFMTHTEILEKVKESLTPDLPIDRTAIDGLEEGLLGADVGAELTMALVDRMEERVRSEKITSMERLTAVLREETPALIPHRTASTIEVSPHKPFVVLVVGVSGNRENNNLAQLAQRATSGGGSPLLGD